jgi:hypothetical protein
MSGEYASVGTETSGVKDRAYAAPDAGLGFVTFAVFMLLIAGTINIVYGIAAISNSSFYTAGARHVLFDDLAAWGWVVLIIGALQVGAGIAIWAQSEFGRWLGVGLASCGAIVQLLFMPSAPFLSLALFGVNVLIVYGLVVHGERREVTY